MMYNIVVIDSSRGNEEGTELEKIVAWYPAETSHNERIRVAGLLQGLLHFSSLFDDEPGAADIVDFDTSYWVIGSTPVDNLFLSIMVEKQYLGRHVTETNFIGLLYNFLDVLRMILPSNQPSNEMFSRLTKMYGDTLHDKGSWLRKQLRNPFGLTWGAITGKLPHDLQSVLRQSCVDLSIELALFKDETCLYSNLGHNLTNQLGSLVLSGIQTCFFLNNHIQKRRGQISGETYLYGRNSDTYFVMTFQGFSVFALSIAQNDSLDLEKEANDMIQTVSDFIESFGWSGIKSRHVHGSRYLSKNAERITCSPRNKVSSSSHHTRAIATTLMDYKGHVNNGFIYICDKSSDSWGSFSADNEDFALSVSLKGLDRRNLADDFNAAKKSHSNII